MWQISYALNPDSTVHWSSIGAILPKPWNPRLSFSYLGSNAVLHLMSMKHAGALAAVSPLDKQFGSNPAPACGLDVQPQRTALERDRSACPGYAAFSSE